jgi:hypothetical protein
MDILTMTTVRTRLRQCLGVAVLLTSAAPAVAEVDTYEIWHKEGACAEYRFPSNHMNWANRSRINIARGEKIHVRLWGHGADLASDAGADGIHEWIVSKGRSTDYPNAPISGGQRVPKGYVTVAIEATSSHSTGNKTVTVTWPWPGQPETIPVKVVSSCEALLDDAYRQAPDTPTASTGTINPISPPLTGTIATPAPFVDLMPRASLYNIFRRVPESSPVTVNNATFLRVDDRWCQGMAIPAAGSASRNITVPGLDWGVTNAGTAANGAAFTSRLRAGTATLMTATTAAGALGPGATANFAFQRPNSAARVIRFAIPQPQGCLVNPLDQGFWEDPPLTVEVDVVPAGGSVAEGANEANNSRTF